MPLLRDGLIVAKVGWAAILCALFLPLGAQLGAQQAISLSATVTPTTTLLLLPHHRISLKRDSTVARPTPAPTLKLIAELPGQALLLTDTYPSRPMGLSRCQAGEEQFLRLITHKPHPKETFHLKLASCRDNLELAEDGLQWSSTTQTLVIRWLIPPASQPNPLTLHIARNGRLLR